MISIRLANETDVDALCSLDLIAVLENERREFMKYVLSGVIHNLDEGDPEIVYFKRLK